MEIVHQHYLTKSHKIQWLKVYWRNDLAKICSDKLLVRDFVKEKIGSEYLNDLMYVYTNAYEINIESLPNTFVLKATHGSGYNIICRNKNNINWDYELKKLDQWCKTNYYYANREWVYKDIKPKIICEKYLSERNQYNINDYKFYCFNGIPYYCQVIRGRGENETIDFYDMEWNKMPFNGLRELPMSSIDYSKPKDYAKMIELAGILSKGFPFVRVDFYYVDEKIYFGEMTFFPASGMGKFNPDIWDFKLGKLLILPNK